MAAIVLVIAFPLYLFAAFRTLQQGTQNPTVSARWSLSAQLLAMQSKIAALLLIICMLTVLYRGCHVTQFAEIFFPPHSHPLGEGLPTVPDAKESELLEKVRDIRSMDYARNLSIYNELLALRPENSIYRAKVERYGKMRDLDNVIDDFQHGKVELDSAEVALRQNGI